MVSEGGVADSKHTLTIHRKIGVNLLVPYSLRGEGLLSPIILKVSVLPKYEMRSITWLKLKI